MAEVYGVNATLRNNVPSEKIASGDHNSGIARSYDSYAFLAELDTTDTLYMNKIPAGAKVVGIKVSCGDLGTTGLFNIGWGASADGGEAADADGFFAALDVKTAAQSNSEMAYTVAGFNKEFSEEVQLEVVPTEITQAAIGEELHIEVLYVL